MLGWIEISIRRYKFVFFSLAVVSSVDGIFSAPVVKRHHWVVMVEIRVSFLFLDKFSSFFQPFPCPLQLSKPSTYNYRIVPMSL